MTKNCVVRGLRRPRLLAATMLATALAGVGLSEGCGGRPAARRHASEAQAPAAVPTPDTTPVEALRTPAGLALKTSVEQPRTPSPAAEPTPKSSP
jgi:hypothetical protein